jgi:hypothetical protein
LHFVLPFLIQFSPIPPFIVSLLKIFITVLLYVFTLLCTLCKDLCFTSAFWQWLLIDLSSVWFSFNSVAWRLAKLKTGLNVKSPQTYLTPA